MYCYQCEQKCGDTACTTFGVCGKDPATAAMQDVLVYVAKGLSQYAHILNQNNLTNRKYDVAVVKALFSTVTNVNFDANDLYNQIKELETLKNEAKNVYLREVENAAELTGPAQFKVGENIDACQAQGSSIGILAKIKGLGEDVTSASELLMYGLKGTAAYADHAHVLGYDDDSVYAFFHEALSFLANDPTDLNELLAMNLKCGEVNITVMALLDQANTDKYGHPEPTQVKVSAVKGKAILVSGHDLLDLELLLKQTEGLGINIYTHGEMLPCNAYPELKKYSHLVGNYGGAWQDQNKEFAAFPGAILMTTNCIQRPLASYENRIFTTGLVQYPNIVHIDEKKDFTPVINAALASEGFTTDEEEKNITIGFGHNAVLGVAGAVVDAVKAGDIKHFFLIGGCDGAKSGRNYYTEFAEKVPEDCVILTLACGKYRFNKLEFGNIGGIPRLLDVGQCNDAYSAVKIAMALAEAFDCELNDLPLSFILSWYEQKAVCILLSLLHLGVKNIKLGPSLPAFVSPNLLNILVEKFQIAPISDVDSDLKACLGE
ncbi:hydroxylamine reductase [Lentisphaerota bacterium WC36G]|nr:hydroxylamine reductase [Lentisphaerae bacterium WC36]